MSAPTADPAEMHPHARTEDLEMQWVDDHLIIYDLTNDRAHSLDPLAARVWELADGNRSAAEIVAALDDESLDLEAVWTALDLLGDAELLQQRAGPPAGERRVSRRTLIRDVAAAGVLGLAVPGAVKSILAPEPLAAQSGGGGGSAEESTKESASKEEQVKAKRAEQQAKLDAKAAEEDAKRAAEQQAKLDAKAAEEDAKRAAEQQAKLDARAAEEDTKRAAEQDAKRVQAEQAAKEAAIK